jgi:hypothetical protein
MSAMGQKRTLRRARAMSALPPKADIAWRQLDGFVPDKVLLLYSRVPIQRIEELVAISARL